jgi:DNA-binding MarR family transcriptional regulator
MKSRLDRLVDDDGVLLWGMVVALHRTLNDRLHADISAASGLDEAEFEFLLRLARFPHAQTHATRVPASMGYTSAGVTKLVFRLKSKGLIIRTRDPQDGRAFIVKLTPEGRRLLELGIEAHVPRLHTELLDRLTPTQQRQLRRLLARIDATLQTTLSA